jgi:hypothetical protein
MHDEIKLSPLHSTPDSLASSGLILASEGLTFSLTLNSLLCFVVVVLTFSLQL